jgi:PadR family transcriptional regulator PadR
MSSIVKRTQQRVGFLQGTLDMLVLRTLLYGAAHGRQVGKHIQRTTNDFLQMQHGSLYPALHRLERRGWVSAKWETAPDRNQEFNYYRLTDGLSFRPSEHRLALIHRVLRGGAPWEFALQFPQPAQFTTELLDHEADHPHGFMKPVAHFFLDRS